MEQNIRFLIEKLEFMSGKKVILKESTDEDSFIIGKTRSEKPIYNAAYKIGTNIIHPGHKNFSKEDHMDAIALHKRMYDKYNKKRKEVIKKLELDPKNKELLAAKKHYNYEMAIHRLHGYSHAEYYGNSVKPWDSALYPKQGKAF